MSRRTATTRKPPKPRSNPLLAAGITYIDYKDTGLLRKFISDRGKIRSRRVTRVTAQQQRQIAAAVKNAREMGLLPYATQRGPSGPSGPSGAQSVRSSPAS
ncbi:30S ribosomal protein S18 [Streptomyces sp. NPDC057694]|uniref:30S ribosomal protein S18 n=1 Tax=unclassified Streptomyces TaxID=2593676 RepID=UPI00368C6D5C